MKFAECISLKLISEGVRKVYITLENFVRHIMVQSSSVVGLNVQMSVALSFVH